MVRIRRVLVAPFATMCIEKRARTDEHYGCLARAHGVELGGVKRDAFSARDPIACPPSSRIARRDLSPP